MHVLSLLVLVLLVLNGCGGKEDGVVDDDAGPDGDADADSDADADADGDADGDADTDCADDRTCSPGLRCVHDTCVPEAPCQDIDDSDAFCTTTTAAALLPGTCAPTSCAWDPASVEEPTDVHVAVDAGGVTTECHEGNNEAILPGLTCPAIE